MAEFCACGKPLKGRFATCWGCQLKAARSEGYDLGYQSGFLAGEQAKAKEKDMIITKERYTRLRMLCHPDKHNGSKMAEEISAWLNSIKPQE